MDLFAGLGDQIKSLGAGLVSALKVVGDIFWDSAATTPGPTLVGYLLIAVIAAAFIKFGIRLIMSLFSKIR